MASQAMDTVASMTLRVAVCYAGRYIEIFQSKRMDYYSAIVGQMQSQVRAIGDKGCLLGS